MKARKVVNMICERKRIWNAKGEKIERETQKYNILEVENYVYIEEYSVYFK